MVSFRWLVLPRAKPLVPCARRQMVFVFVFKKDEHGMFEDVCNYYSTHPSPFTLLEFSFVPVHRALYRYQLTR